MILRNLLNFNKIITIAFSTNITGNEYFCNEFKNGFLILCYILKISISNEMKSLSYFIDVKIEKLSNLLSKGLTFIKKIKCKIFTILFQIVPIEAWKFIVPMPN